MIGSINFELYQKMLENLQKQKRKLPDPSTLKEIKKMRHSVTKRINELVNDEEVIIESKFQDGEKYLKRLKKDFWNRLNWKERTSRMKVFHATKFLKSVTGA